MTKVEYNFRHITYLPKDSHRLLTVTALILEPGLRAQILCSFHHIASGFQGSSFLQTFTSSRWPPGTPLPILLGPPQSFKKPSPLTSPEAGSCAHCRKFAFTLISILLRAPRWYPGVSALTSVDEAFLLSTLWHHSVGTKSNTQVSHVPFKEKAHSPHLDSIYSSFPCGSTELG